MNYCEDDNCINPSCNSHGTGVCAQVDNCTNFFCINRHSIKRTRPCTNEFDIGTLCENKQECNRLHVPKNTAILNLYDDRIFHWIVDKLPHLQKYKGLLDIKYMNNRTYLTVNIEEPAASKLEAILKLSYYQNLSFHPPISSELRMKVDRFVYEEEKANVFISFDDDESGYSTFFTFFAMIKRYEKTFEQILVWLNEENMKNSQLMGSTFYNDPNQYNQNYQQNSNYYEPNNSNIMNNQQQYHDNFNNNQQNNNFMNNHDHFNPHYPLQQNNNFQQQYDNFNQQQGHFNQQQNDHLQQQNNGNFMNNQQQNASQNQLDQQQNDNFMNNQQQQQQQNGSFNRHEHDQLQQNNNFQQQYDNYNQQQGHFNQQQQNNDNFMNNQQQQQQNGSFNQHEHDSFNQNDQLQQNNNFQQQYDNFNQQQGHFNQQQQQNGSQNQQDQQQRDNYMNNQQQQNGSFDQLQQSNFQQQYDNYNQQQGHFNQQQNDHLQQQQQQNNGNFMNQQQQKFDNFNNNQQNNHNNEPFNQNQYDPMYLEQQQQQQQQPGYYCNDLPQNFENQANVSQNPMLHPVQWKFLEREYKIGEFYEYNYNRGELLPKQQIPNDLFEFITVNQPSFSELKEHGILYENCCKKYLNENGFNPLDVAIESFENQIFLVTKTRQLFIDIVPQLAFTRDRSSSKVAPVCKNLIDVSQDKKKPEFFNEFSSFMDFDYQKDELRIVATSFLAPEIKNFEKKYSAWETKQVEKNAKKQKYIKKAAAASKGNSKNQVNRNQSRRNSNSPSSGHKNTKQDKNQAKSKSSLKDSSSGVNNSNSKEKKKKLSENQLEYEYFEDNELKISATKFFVTPIQYKLLLESRLDRKIETNCKYNSNQYNLEFKNVDRQFQNQVEGYLASTISQKVQFPNHFKLSFEMKEFIINHANERIKKAKLKDIGIFLFTENKSWYLIGIDNYFTQAQNELNDVLNKSIYVKEIDFSSDISSFNTLNIDDLIKEAPANSIYCKKIKKSKILLLTCSKFVFDKFERKISDLKSSPSSSDHKSSSFAQNPDDMFKFDSDDDNTDEDNDLDDLDEYLRDDIDDDFDDDIYDDDEEDLSASCLGNSAFSVPISDIAHIYLMQKKSILDDLENRHNITLILPPNSNVITMNKKDNAAIDDIKDFDGSLAEGAKYDCFTAESPLFEYTCGIISDYDCILLPDGRLIGNRATMNCAVQEIDGILAQNQF